MDYRKPSNSPQNHRDPLTLSPLGWLTLAALVPTLGMATALAISPATPSEIIPSIAQFTETLPLPEFALPAEQHTNYWRSETLQRNDTLPRLLQRLGIHTTQIEAFLNDTAVSRILLQLPPSTVLHAQTNHHGELLNLRFLRDDDNGEANLFLIHKVQDQRWQLHTDTIAPTATETLRSVRIQPDMTLQRAFRAGGVPLDIRAQLMEIFAERAPLDKLRTGDAIEVIYESFYYDGELIGYGRVLAAEVRTASQLTQAFYHQHDSESGNYYDFSGRPIKKGFEREVLTETRITSGYGLRVHPVLGGIRMHHGIDYAAAVGTPVYAPAEGSVELMTTQGGYGKILIIRHDDRTQTAYAHLSAFAPHLSIGQKVRAGERIAFTGNTGRSTGPHLHFEIRIDGRPVDPSIAVIKSYPLIGANMQRFALNSRELNRKLGLLSAIPVRLAQTD